MHCPFCVKTESYTDPVILKAHYRVKHVDKGVEFAGKHLRSLGTNDVVETSNKSLSKITVHVYMKAMAERAGPVKILKILQKCLSHYVNLKQTIYSVL